MLINYTLDKFRIYYIQFVKNVNFLENVTDGVQRNISEQHL